ncbi:MAG TPA: DUF3488 and transglutaminase-like domain-containing protein [Myxococcaceae bacterium]|nr:DUF3488 and transglutaminase-like domain-containing protein [Myxococcaceae bacterium]
MSARLNRVRLRLRDLAAGAAFGSLVISWQLPSVLLLLAAAGFVLALFDRRPFGDRHLVGGVFLLLAGALCFGMVWKGPVDLVVGACCFATLLTLQRMLSAPGPAVDAQVNLASLLMVAGGGALSGDLLYAPMLALYAVFSILAMGLGVVSATVAPGTTFPLRRVLLPLSVGAGLAMVLGLTFFILFPRLSWNMAGGRVSTGLGPVTTGFSDQVRLGGSGSIKSNPRVVARVHLSPDPGDEALNRYWIGRTYDTFDGVRWTAQRTPVETEGQIRLSHGGDRLIHQEIELLPAYGARTALALEAPSLFGGAVANTHKGRRRTRMQRLENGEIRFEREAPGYDYHAYSLPADVTREVPALTTGDLDRARSLPADLDPRIPALAQRLLAGEQDPLRAAERLARHLSTRFRYSMELPGEHPDALSHFLFERQEGHCEHFATALTVLLRTQGIPARLATGFFGGERLGDDYILRAGDAHAWTQVLVPGRGWVSVDATPPAFRSAQPEPFLTWLVDRYEALEERWRNSVVDYDIRDQWAFLSGMLSDRERHDVLAGEVVEARPRRALGMGLGAFFGVLLLGWILERRVRRPRSDPATRFHHRLRRTVQRDPTIGAGLARGVPIEELARRLRQTDHPAATPLDDAVRRYLEARFGSRPLGAREASQLLQRLRSALGTAARSS